MYRNVYPLSAIVGQDALKQALMIGAVNPAVGGVLIRGEKGTAKSTAVRALAALLPEIDVITGCPFSCDPAKPDQMCSECRSRYPQLVIEQRKVRVVNLPLNATEERVAGGIDFSLAVQRGYRLLSPGLLADSNRGILYVDEVNLLDDHIVDIILDAASSGENRIEREGISFSHKARFMLVGTMNPEEGELRPQLLDRFGLCVEVCGNSSPDERVSLMKLRDDFDQNRKVFIEKYESSSQQLAKQISDARRLLPKTRLPRHLRSFIAELCTENNVAGHRADIVMEQAARALAALNMQNEVTLNDIRQVAPLVLLHRHRDAQAPPPTPPPPESEQDRSDQSEIDNSLTDESENGQSRSERPSDESSSEDQNKDYTDQNQGTSGEEQSQPSDADPLPSEDHNAQPDNRDEEPYSEKNMPEPQNGRDNIFQIGSTFKVRNLSSDKDRLFRRGSGRRSRSKVSQKQGRYVKSCINSYNGDIALDATLRAAAPYQKQRRKNNGSDSGIYDSECHINTQNIDSTRQVNLKNLRRDNISLNSQESDSNTPFVILTSQDVRGRIREKRIGNFLLFMVDASGSMGARGRMAASKGAVMSLLLDAYQKRDRVGMISFRRDQAVVNLPPTTSVELAGKLLTEMPVGGRTPLSAGLVKTYEQVRNILLRDPSARPIVIMITDGKSNVAINDLKPVEEALNLAQAMTCDERVKYIVVDTEESGHLCFGLAGKLADALHAQYFKIDDLKTKTLVDIVKEKNM